MWESQLQALKMERYEFCSNGDTKDLQVIVAAWRFSLQYAKGWWDVSAGVKVTKDDFGPCNQ